MRRLPQIIVGGLPTPQELAESNRNSEHRVIHVVQNPDGKSERCRCGWQSPLCRDDDESERYWNEHIDRGES